MTVRGLIVAPWRRPLVGPHRGHSRSPSDALKRLHLEQRLVTNP